MEQQQRRKKEKRLVEKMILLYCKGNHHGAGLCKDCAVLRDCAFARIDKCPFMETKTFCSNCKVHCYRPEMREKIKKVMRWSGPRMLFHHPALAVSHVILMKKEKKGRTA